MQGMSNEGSAIAAERLAARVEREGPVLKLETGGIGVFCPELAGKLDKENSEHLFVVESLADLFRRHERVRWTEVRSLIATRSAELTGAQTLEALQSRMRQALDALCGRELDATPAVWKVMAHPLVPLVIDGLDARGVEVSTGSACSAGVPQPSHVLLAMGRDEVEARSSLRFSLGHTSTEADVDAVAAAIGPAVERARAVRA